MRMQLVMYLYRAQVLFCFFFFCFVFYIRGFYNKEPPHERERHKNHKFRLATLPVYHAFQ